MICCAVVDRDQVRCSACGSDVELGGQEQPVQAADLLGVEGVAHAERPALVVLQRDDDLALVPAAEVAADEAGRVLGPQVGEGDASQEVLVVGAQTPARRAVRRRVSISSSPVSSPPRIARDQLLQTLASGAGPLAEHGLAEETQPRLRVLVRSVVCSP